MDVHTGTLLKGRREGERAEGENHHSDVLSAAMRLARRKCIAACCGVFALRLVAYVLYLFQTNFPHCSAAFSS